MRNLGSNATICRYMKKIKVLKSKVHGRGVFADEMIRKGQKIQYIKGPKVVKKIHNSKESRKIASWIGIGKYTWINTDKSPFKYINHSCRPNAAIIGKRTLVALEDIRPNQEIFIDYSMTDSDPYWSIQCHCAERTCRKIIGPITTVPANIFKEHMPYIPKNFQRIYVRSRNLNPSI